MRNSAFGARRAQIVHKLQLYGPRSAFQLGTAAVARPASRRGDAGQPPADHSRPAARTQPSGRQEPSGRQPPSSREPPSNSREPAGPHDDPPGRARRGHGAQSSPAARGGQPGGQAAPATTLRRRPPHPRDLVAPKGEAPENLTKSLKIRLNSLDRAQFLFRYSVCFISVSGSSFLFAGWVGFRGGCGLLGSFWFVFFGWCLSFSFVFGFSLFHLHCFRPPAASSTRRDARVWHISNCRKLVSFFPTLFTVFSDSSGAR